MSGYVTHIKSRAQENEYFREVLFTGPHSQLVVMSLGPGEEIGQEVHDDVDQFIRIEFGEGVALLDGEEHEVRDGSAIVIPAGVEHNLTNRSDNQPLKLYTLYTPPEHPDGTVHQTQEEAQAYEEAHGH